MMSDDATRIAELEALCAAQAEHIKKLGIRIHRQRVALRERWEILETRSKWPGHRVGVMILKQRIAAENRVAELEATVSRLAEAA